MSSATLTLPSLADVDAYPVPSLLVPRIMKNYNRDRTYAEGIVREAKRMLYLSQVSGQPVTPSVEIDDAWHEMILFTKFYHEFCAFIGTDYIHHTPTGDDESEGEGSGGGEMSVYDQTIENYRRYIAEPDEKYWTP